MPMTGFLTYEYLTTSFYEFWTSETSRYAKIGFWAAVMALGLATRAAGFFYSLFAWYFVVPFLVVLPVTRYWAEVSEHIGLDLRGDFGNSRTNIGVLHRWYLNPHFDGYHAVHHLCSQVPFYLLPTVHGILMDAEEEFKRGTVGAKGVVETFWQVRNGKTAVKGMGS